MAPTLHLFHQAPLVRGMRSIHVLVVLVLDAVTGWSFFYPKPECHTDGLCDRTTELGLSAAHGPVVAICDWNGDRYTDLLSLNGTTLGLHLWNRDEYKFHDVLRLQLPLALEDQSMAVVGITAQDFDNDGHVDLLVTLQGKDHMKVQIFLHDDPEGTDETHLRASGWQATVDDEVLVANLFGSGSVDLFGSSNGHRMAWRNKGTPGKVVLVGTQLPGSQLATPHTSSTVDVNGDCVADLVTVTLENGVKYLEFWSVKTLAEGQPMARIMSLHGLGLLSWTDIDSDGDLDIIAPVEHKGRWRYILILYNQQGTKDPACASDLCCLSEFAFHEFDHPFADPSSLLSCDYSAGYLLLDLGDEPMDYRTWTNGISAPPRVRVGDFNIDGYPDFVVVTDISNGSGTAAHLWKNEPCVGQPCSRCGSPRMMVHQKAGAEVLKGMAGVFDGFFYTYNEEGASDLIFMGGAGSHTKLWALKNDFFNDAFFLKALASRVGGVKGKKFFGAALPGTMLKLTWADLDTNPRVQMGVQLPTSTHNALNLPYTFSGLGRTNSYIDQFVCGSYQEDAQKKDTHEWLGLIPNSQVFVLLTPSDDGPKWSLEIYVSPSKITFWVAASVAGGLALLAVPVWYLHRQERLADEIERRAKAPIPFS